MQPKTSKYAERGFMVGDPVQAEAEIAVLPMCSE
jgi:hypothetical protein